MCDIIYTVHCYPRHILLAYNSYPPILFLLLSWYTDFFHCLSSCDNISPTDKLLLSEDVASWRCNKKAKKAFIVNRIESVIRKFVYSWLAQFCWLKILLEMNEREQHHRAVSLSDPSSSLLFYSEDTILHTVHFFLRDVKLNIIRLIAQLTFISVVLTRCQHQRF